LGIAHFDKLNGKDTFIPENFNHDWRTILGIAYETETLYL